MKKTLFLTLVLFAATFNMQAQLMKIGVKAGANYANFTNSSIQTDAITSYHAGLVAELKLLDKLAIQPELLYSTQGASYTNLDTEIKNERGYLAIPVLVKVFLGDTFSLEVGPQASFLLSEKNKFRGNDSKTFDFSVAAGLGLKVTENLFLQGRYVLGLTEVSTDAQAKNSVFQLSAGIMF